MHRKAAAYALDMLLAAVAGAGERSVTAAAEALEGAANVSTGIASRLALVASAPPADGASYLRPEGRR